MFKTLIFTLNFCLIFNFYYSLTEETPVKNQFLLNQFNWNGKYKLSIKGEKLNNGEMSGRDYTFIINDDKASIVTNSYHEPVFCDGEYKVLKKNNQLLIIYAGDNPDFCNQNQANFIIKKEKNIFYIKGSDFYIEKWLLLKKVKS